MAEVIKVMLVDDHQVMIDGLASIFENNNNYEVVGKFNAANLALLKINDNKPHVILMDINMPVMNGLEATKIVKEKYDDIKVLILSMNNDFDSISTAATIGADGYILKNAGIEEITKAVQKIYEGGTYYGAEVSSALLKGIRIQQYADGNQPIVPKKTATEIIEALTDKERLVLKYICNDYKMSEIADIMKRSEFTIVTHKRNIFKKLEVSSIGSLIRLCYDLGVLDLISEE
ncbi:MAG: response regulator transcription factor [Bacteroidetes bacterium]|nr:response regulator transcription factor [Bacteroidota bacterium]